MKNYKSSQEFVNLDRERSGIEAVAKFLYGYDLPSETTAVAKIKSFTKINDNKLKLKQELPIPDELGIIYEKGCASHVRKKRGIWFTPKGLAEFLTSKTFDSWSLAGNETHIPTVLDPSCGCGAFLLAAVREQIRRGVSPEMAFSSLYGFDIDYQSLLIARAALELYALSIGENPDIANKVTLLECNFLEAKYEVEEVDLIVGNPPFMSQLRSRTTRMGREKEIVSEILGGLSLGYIDTSMLFLIRALECIRDNGVATLILPASIAASRDSDVGRKLILDKSNIVFLWRDERKKKAFSGVPVIAICIRKCIRKSNKSQKKLLSGIERYIGLDFNSLPVSTLEYNRGSGWGSLLVDNTKHPDFLNNIKVSGFLGDAASVSADFRDQYYGLTKLVKEELDSNGDYFRLMTTGSIDPAEFRFDKRIRFSKTVWESPVVEELALYRTELAEWGKRLLVEKILVATQTKVIEAFTDYNGTIIPCPPIISVIPSNKSDLWKIASVLNSPVAALWAIYESVGTAFTLDTIKLSATQLRLLPLPSGSLDKAAKLQQQAQAKVTTALERRKFLGQSSFNTCLSYGLDEKESEEATNWWLSRLRDLSGTGI